MFADKEWPRCQARVCSAPALPGRGDGGGAGPGPAEPFPTDPLLTASFMTDPIPTDPIPTGSAPGGMRRGESVPGLFPHLPGFGNSRAGSGRGGIPPGWGWNPTGAEPLGSSQGFVALGSRKARIVQFRASYCPEAPGRALELVCFQVGWILFPAPAHPGKSPCVRPLPRPWEGQHSRYPCS